MSKDGLKVINTAKKYLGADFRHHFKPENLCSSGTETVDSCMEHGLSDDGFDCSGLVIASLCDVLTITPDKWPRALRHSKQLEALEERTRSKLGDIATFHRADTTSLHIGILVADYTVIHASGYEKKVVQGEIRGNFPRIGIIPSENFLKLASRHKKVPKTTDKIGGTLIHYGGAAGYCPPVQKVTGYSSTSIVCLGF